MDAHVDGMWTLIKQIEALNVNLSSMASQKNKKDIKDDKPNDSEKTKNEKPCFDKFMLPNGLYKIIDVKKIITTNPKNEYFNYLVMEDGDNIEVRESVDDILKKMKQAR